MNKDFSALSFSEKERACESIFIANGPYWHVYTDGTMMQNIFCNEEEFKTGMWCIAVSIHMSKGVRALTFELMANHVHLIIAGQRENCLKAFDLFAARLRQAFPKRQRTIDWSKFKMDILPIESLQALRNEIIYANRNAFVANPSYTPDSYPWGGGCAYFCPWLKHLTTTPLNEVPILTQRAWLHTKKIASFADLRVIDSIFLTDEELYSVICSHISKEYSVKAPSQLSAQQKIDTARHMHFSYNASNRQLKRMLRLDLAVLEELFP